MSFHEAYVNTPDGSNVTFEITEVDPNGDLYGVIGNILQINFSPEGNNICFTAGEKDFAIDLGSESVEALYEWLEKNKGKAR